MYSQEYRSTGIGFQKSDVIMKKQYLSLKNFRHKLAEKYQQDLWQFETGKSPYSYKRTNFPMQLHLTFIVESRVLRIQKMCRFLFKVRNRAAKTITAKMRMLRSKKLLLKYTGGSSRKKSGESFFVQSGRLSSQRKSAEQ